MKASSVYYVCLGLVVVAAFFATDKFLGKLETLSAEASNANYKLCYSSGGIPVSSPESGTGQKYFVCIDRKVVIDK